MQGDDSRRIDRVSVCCRVDVHDRFGVWTAVTEDVCARGCRILTHRLPRLGSLFSLRLSSDLFDEELHVRARAVWGTAERIGVTFLDTPPRAGALSPAEWLGLVVEHGRPTGAGLRAIDSPSVVPVITAARARPTVRPELVRPASARAHEPVVALRGRGS